MSRLEQRLNWARDQVGVSPGASFSDVRTTFLAAAERENFVPDEGLDRAFRTLRWEAEGVIDAEDPPEFLQAEESELYEAVEGFALKMFSWPMAERRQRWAELYGRCEYAPRLRARLDRLAPGLDLELMPPSESGRQMHVPTLARYAAELFPMRPAARAARRHAILTALYKDDIKPWRKAAQSLKYKHAQLAALAPDLVDQLATAGIAPKPAPSVSVRRETTRGTGWALAFAACILIGFILRASSRMSSYSTSPSHPRINQNINVDVEQLLERLRQNQQPGAPGDVEWSPAAPPGGAVPETPPLWTPEQWGQRYDVQQEKQLWERLRPNRQPGAPADAQGSPAAPPGGAIPETPPIWTPQKWGQRIDVQQEIERMQRAVVPSRRPGEPWPTTPTPGERDNPGSPYRSPGSGPWSPSSIPPRSPNSPSPFPPGY